MTFVAAELPLAFKLVSQLPPGVLTLYLPTKPQRTKGRYPSHQSRLSTAQTFNRHLEAAILSTKI